MLTRMWITTLLCLSTLGCNVARLTSSSATRESPACSNGQYPSDQESKDDSRNAKPSSVETRAEASAVSASSQGSESTFEITLMVASQLVPPNPAPTATQDDPPTNPELAGLALTLESVMESVYRAYPLLEAAYQERAIASGQQLSTEGAFDLQLKGEGMSGPSGFYQTYRNSMSLEQPVFEGGSVFGGYRVGRGDFQPWYLERQTNNGGELRAGFRIPLARNRTVDARRAALWRAMYGRERAEPLIQARLIEFLRAAAFAYWEWIAAGRNYQISQSLLRIAEQRQIGLKKRVDEGDLAEIELTDNERLIVTRQAKLIEAERKLNQAAIKLSLFLRTESGEPLIPENDRLPKSFPDAAAYDVLQRDVDIQRAIENRPELRSLDLQYRQLDVDLQQARNLYLPSLDATVVGSQDVGQASSKKRDKSEFELEAGVVLQVPIQRRNALGKVAELEGKIAQLRATRQFAANKITTDVQNAVAGLLAAFEQIQKAHRSLELAQTMEQAERRKFDLGDSNLLLVNLREQATADAAFLEVVAKQEYFRARADLRAAIASDVDQ